MITILLIIIFLLVVYGVVVTWAAIINRNDMQRWYDECERLSEDLVTCFERYEGADPKEVKLLLPEIREKLNKEKGMGIVVD